jgi:hypothetical protein
MRPVTLLHAPMLLLAIAIIACGPTGGAPAVRATIVLNHDSAGKTVQAHVGDTIQVELQESFPVPGSSLVWDVSSSAPSVLKLSKVTRDPAERPRQGQVAYTAEFAAEGAGQATLFMRGSRTCEAMPTCQQEDLMVTVVIS